MKRCILSLFTFFLCLTAFASNDLPFRINVRTASYIRDAVYSPKYNHVFFFSGSYIMLYDMASTKEVDSSWVSLGDLGNIDASLLWDGGHLLLFSGTQYVLYEIDSARVVSDWVLWPALPQEWNGKLDAAVRWSSDEIMFFSGTEYLLYNIAKKEYTERNYFIRWDGWPAKWQGALTCVLNINNRFYFLQNGEYITIDPLTQKFSQPEPIWMEK